MATSFQWVSGKFASRVDAIGKNGDAVVGLQDPADLTETLVDVVNQWISFLKSQCDLLSPPLQCRSNGCIENTPNTGMGNDTCAKSLSSILLRSSFPQARLNEPSTFKGWYITVLSERTILKRPRGCGANGNSLNENRFPIFMDANRLLC